MKYAEHKGNTSLSNVLLNDDEITLGESLQYMNDNKIENVVTEDTLIKTYSALRKESLGSKDHQKLNGVVRSSEFMAPFLMLKGEG